MAVILIVFVIVRSSRSDVFCKKGALKNFAKIHRKTPAAETTTNLINTYFISAMFRMCFFSLLLSFNDEKNKVTSIAICKSQVMTMIKFNIMIEVIEQYL